MSQLQITSKQGVLFREYEVEAGDTVPEISFRFGQPDWQSIYSNSVNAPFRARFADPLQLVVDSSVKLYVPLPGRSGTGVSVYGAPLADYLAAHLVDGFGQPLSNVAVRLVEPGVPLSLSRAVTTTVNGDIFIPNPKAGSYSLVSPDYELVPPQTVASVPLISDASGVYVKDSDPATHFLLSPNVVNQIAAVRVFYIVCPMCAITFRIKIGPGDTILCPHDGFDLTDIEAAVRTDANSFISATSTAGKLQTADNLKCRGYTESTSLFGPVPIFWDESRFADPLGDDYRLCAFKGGAVLLGQVIGRKTWGARAPILTSGRNYQFHATPDEPSPPYAGLTVPNNQTNRLSSVLKWITVHHTGVVVQKDGVVTVDDVQKAHQGPSGIAGSPAADIGYHFFIEPDGKLYEARPLGIAGSHVPKFNAANIGIVLSGHFGADDPKTGKDDGKGKDTPTDAALNTLKNLITVLTLRFGIRSVWTHNQRKKQSVKSGTACPGKRLTPEVDALRLLYSGPPA
jgi:hypothetical protein